MDSKLGHGAESALNGREAAGVRSDYAPAVDEHALALIARIRRNHADVEAVHALATHYESHGDLPSLANLMEGWAPTLSEDRKAAEAYLRAAWAVAHGLGDRARELSLYERAVERFPEHPSALSTLEAMLRARGDEGALEQVLGRAATTLGQRLCDPKLRAGVHRRLGELFERQGSPSRAIAQYRASLELDGSCTEVIAAARAIYQQSSKAGPVADMFELEIAATEDPERRCALLRNLAEHRRDSLVDLDGAVLALRRALKAVPNDLTALERLAELLRERSRRAGSDESEADRTRAAELFFQLARNVPRRDARPRLLACLRLHPGHARANAMLCELEAFGAGQAVPPDADRSQAELEGKVTGRYEPVSGQSAAPTTAAAAAAASADDDEFEAWLNDDEIESIEDDVGLERMVPLSERPPAPESAGPPPPPSLRTRTG